MWGRRFICSALLLVATAAAAFAGWASFQDNGAPLTPPGFGGGPNLRAQNVFGAPITVTPDQYYVPGTGSPAVSTSDYYYVNGSIEQRPYDLTKAECGAPGAAAATKYGRYAWVMTPNHNGSGTTADGDGLDIYIGFSSDPGVFPPKVTPIFRNNNVLPLAPGATFTATIASNVLTVTGSPTGLISVSDVLSGAGVTAGAKIASINTGTGIGGAGTYDLSPGSANVASPTSMTAQQPNFTVVYFPYFLCNPDDTSTPFYVYMQGGTQFSGGIVFETGLIRSNDMFSWSTFGASHRLFKGDDGFVRNQQVVRVGASSWKSFGPSFVFSQTGNQVGNGIWTSTDGQFFTFSQTFTNQCIPVYNPGGGGGPNFCPDGSSDFFIDGALNDGLTFTVGAQAYMAASEAANTIGQSNTTGQYVARVAVDSNYNVIASPVPVRISNQYQGYFPGPTYLGSVGNFIEDGVGHYYATHGNYECLLAAGCDPALQQKYGAVVSTTSSGTAASGSGTTAVLHMSSVAGLFNGMSIAGRTNGNVAFGSTIQSISGNDVTLLGPLNNSPPPSNFPPIPTTAVGTGDSFLFYSSGLRQEFIDYYTEIVDPVAAAGAAPFGVTASASGGVVTVTCYDALPTNTYRLYRGSSATSQSTLVGNFTGCPATDQPILQVPQVLYYKLVYVNAGTEQKSRIVSTYVSSSTAFVNAHITRGIAAGCDPGTIDRAWLDTVDAWLTSNNLQKNLQTWMNPAFCVTQNASSVVSTAFDLGTTRLPRGGDYTPHDTVTHTSVYNPTGLNGTTPALVNTDSQAFGYFGSGRINNIRRKTQVTACASYSKPGTAVATPLVFGAPDLQPPQMSLQHVAGSPGSVAFILADDVGNQTATASIALATGPHVICGTFNTNACTTATCTATSLIAYADGVAGSPVSGLHANVDQSLATTLSGSTAGTQNSLSFLGSGSDGVKNSLSAVNSGPLAAYNYVTETNQANFSFSDLILFDVALTPTQIASLNTLIATRVTPPTAIAYNITAAPYNATCNGVADDSAAFAAWTVDAVAWDVAHPSTPGSIVLNIPNSSCMFLQGGSGVRLVQGITDQSQTGAARVRIVGAGTSAKMSDGGTGGGFFPGAIGEDFSGASQELTHTAVKGATSVTLSACPGAGCSAALAKFTIGQWARQAGIDMQGPGGNPTNPAFWDYVLISGKTATDIQFTTTPLTHDYKSTWPSYDATGYAGGPATLYAMHSSWPLTVEYNNLIIDQTNTTGDGAAVPGKSVSFKNVTINGIFTCGVPSQNQVFQLINATMPNCSYEIDKTIDNLLIQNATVHALNFQSASVKQFVLDSSNVTLTMNGNGINSTIANSTLASYSIGPTSFGGAYGQTIVLNSSLPSVAGGGASGHGGDNLRGTWAGGIMTVPGNRSVTGATSGTGGVIRLAVSSSAGYSPGLVTDVNTNCTGLATFVISAVPDGTHVELAGTTFTTNCTGNMGSLPFTWAVPELNIYWAATRTSGPMLQVADLTQDATNTYISFNQGGAPYAGGFPTMQLNAGLANARVHSAPQFTCSGCTGSADALDLSTAPPGAPLWSHSLRTITQPSGIVSGAPTIPLLGQLLSTAFTVNVASTAGGAMNASIDPFVNAVNSNAAAVGWNVLVNAKLLGTCTILPTSASGTGAQAGCSPALPGPGANTWLFPGQVGDGFSTAPAGGDPVSVTIEIKTNQGVVNQNFLLKRDLDPAANDNSPMWLNQAA